MEEKLKAPDGQSGDSEMRLFQQCRELQALVREKEDVIAQLEQQLEEQVQHMDFYRCAANGGFCFYHILFLYFFIRTFVMCLLKSTLQ